MKPCGQRTKSHLILVVSNIIKGQFGLKEDKNMDIKLNDVYRFRYREEMIKCKFEPYWCFDSQLIVTQNKKRELFLVDTYWGFGNSANKCFNN